MPTVNPSSLGGPKPQFELSDGTPAVGCQLFFYVAGSVNTKQATFTDSTGAVANTNPVVLNALGMPTTEIWFESGLAYKVVYAPANDPDPPTSPIFSVDFLYGINDTTTPGQSEWESSGLTPTFVSAVSFTLVGDQTTEFAVGRRVQVVDAGGTKYGTITTSVFGALTTVTLDMDGAQVLQNPTTSVSFGLMSSSNPSTPLITDEFPVVSGSADRTKKLRFEVDGFTAGAIRVLTAPNYDGTIATLAGVETLSGKTLDTATIATTQSVNDNSTKLATTAYADRQSGMVRLNSGTVAAAATLDIVMTAYTAYKNKKLILTSFIPANDGVSLQLRTSTNGGGAYDAAATDYGYAFRVIDNTAAAADTGAAGTALLLTTAFVGNASSEGISADVNLYDTTNAAVWTRCTWEAVYVDSSATPRLAGTVGWGARATPADVDAIRVMFSAGNITSGTWVLYGFN